MNIFTKTSIIYSLSPDDKATLVEAVRVLRELSVLYKKTVPSFNSTTDKIVKKDTGEAVNLSSMVCDLSTIYDMDNLETEICSPDNIF